MKVLSLIIGLSSFLAPCIVLSDNPAKLIPREVLFGNPVKTMPQISPNGKQLAFLAPDDKNVLNIWVADPNTLDKAVKITSDSKRGIRSFRWQYDNAHVLYCQDINGDENWHLLQTEIATGRTTDLTPYPDTKAEIIEYNHTHPNELLISLNLKNKQLTDVYKIDLSTGKSNLLIENKENFLDWKADRDLNVRAAMLMTPDGGTAIKTFDPGSGKWETVASFAFEDPAHLLGFADSSNQLLMISSKNGDTAGLVKFDLVSKKETILANDPAYDLSSSILLNPKTYSLEAASVEKEKPGYIALDPAFREELNYLSETLKTPYRITSRNIENNKWIIASLSDTRPVHYYLLDRQTHALRFLFSAQPALDDYKLQPKQPVAFQARDGLTLHGYLTEAIKHGESGKPAILLVHGGPWARDVWNLDPTAQWLANRGYTVLQINYRGSEGYGKRYLNAGNKEWSKKMHTDLLDGIEWLVANGLADRDKVAIFGGSYGGYAALVGLTFTPETFSCAVDIVGPSNLITLIKSCPPYWVPLRKMFDLRVGNIDTEEPFLTEISPLYKADKITKPLLIAQGAHDPRVKQQESDQIAAEMRKQGKEVEYLLFPDEGHGFAIPQNRMKFYAAAEEFLGKHLKGRVQPPSEIENWEALKR